MAKKNNNNMGFHLAGASTKYGFRTVPNESVQWKIQTADGKYFGDVSYGAYKAIVDGKLDEYTPLNDNEKRVLDDFKYSIAGGSDDENKIKETITHSEPRDSYEMRRASNPDMPEYGSDEHYEYIKWEYDMRRKQDPTLPEFASYDYFVNWANEIKPTVVVKENDFIWRDSTGQARTAATNYRENVYYAYDIQIDKLDISDEEKKKRKESAHQNPELYKKYLSKEAYGTAKEETEYAKICDRTLTEKRRVVAQYINVMDAVEALGKTGVHLKNGVSAESATAHDVDVESGTKEAQTEKNLWDVVDETLSFDAGHLGIYADAGLLSEDRLENYNTYKTARNYVASAQHKIKAYEYLDKNKDNKYADDHGGTWGLYYQLGDIGVRQNKANYVAYENMSGDVEAGDVYSILQNTLTVNNADVYDTDGDWAKGAIANIAQHLPQQIEQTTEYIKGFVVGLALTRNAGVAGKAGDAATAIYMFKQTAGNSYYRALKNGLSVEDARALASNEAALSAVIEYGMGRAISGLAGKAVGKVLKTGALEKGLLGKILTKAGMSDKGISTVIKVASGLSGNLGEGAEEWLQEGVSITIDRIAAEGRKVSPIELALETLNFTKYSTEDFKRMGDSFKAGFVVGTFQSATRIGLNKGVNVVANKILGTDSKAIKTAHSMLKSIDDTAFGKEILSNENADSIINKAIVYGRISKNEQTVKLARELYAKIQNGTSQAEEVGHFIKQILFEGNNVFEIKRFATEKTSDAIKELENKAISAGAGESVRSDIVSSAIAIEAMAKKNGKSFSYYSKGVDNLVASGMETFSKYIQGKAKPDYWNLYAKSIKFLSSAENVVDADMIRGYVEIAVELMRQNNGTVYRALSKEGVDIAQALYDYITTGKIPEGITNTKAFLSAAQMMKNILTESITASVTAHKAIYGENATLDAQLKAIKNGDFSSILEADANSQLNTDYESAVEEIETVDDETAREKAENREVVQVLAETPDVFIDNVEECENLPIIINYTKLYLAVRKEGIIKGHYHNLGAEVAKRLPEFLTNPDAIIKLANGRLNVFASVVTDKGNNGVISVELNSVKDINKKYTKYNVIVTMMSSKDNYVKNIIEKDGVELKYQKEDLSQVNPQLYKWLAIINDRSSKDNIPQNEQIVNNNGMQNSENNASKIVTLKQTGYIYSVFEDAKLIYEGADCITDKRVVIPKSTEAIDEISAVSDALIEVADEYKLARVYNKSNSVLIEGNPKVADDGYIFKIDGKFYACRQKDLDAFNNGKRTIKANTNEKTMWSVHNESGELVAVFMPLKTSSITEDMYNSFPYASEIISDELTSHFELESVAVGDVYVNSKTRDVYTVAERDSETTTLYIKNKKGITTKKIANDLADSSFSNEDIFSKTQKETDTTETKRPAEELKSQAVNDTIDTSNVDDSSATEATENLAETSERNSNEEIIKPDNDDEMQRDSSALTETTSGEQDLTNSETIQQEKSRTENKTERVEESSSKGASKRSPSSKKSKGKLEDFGEKIGGAKKDLWRTRGLSIEDISEMSEYDKQKHIKKDNVWRKPDYDKMIESGVPVEVVYFIKKVRDNLPTTPSYSTAYTSERIAEIRESYINGVREVMDYAMSLKTVEGAKQMLEDFFVGKGYVEKGNYGYLSATEKYRQNNALEQKSNLVNFAAKVARNWEYNILKPMKKDQFGVSKDEKIPKGYEIREMSNGEVAVIKGYRIVQGGFATNADALKWAKENLNATSGGKKRFTPPQLSSIHRQGPDYRENNTKDVEGQDYLDTFKFRGGEFGNWMNESDRQSSMNFGYDALMDLAVALSVSPEDISLGGKLAIAFGARGQAGAVAHFEPGSNVINLTKMKGAGSLAHEWGHGFDFFLANVLESKSTFLTDARSKVSEDSLQGIMSKLVNTMKYREMTVDEETARRAANKESTRKKAVAWVDYAFKGVTSKFTEEQQNKFNQLKEEYLQGWDQKGPFEIADKFSELHKEVTGRVIPKETRNNITSWYRIIGYRGDQSAIKGMVKTDFYLNSIEMDKRYSKADKGYWQSDVEMFARAFACYVKDKIPGRSDYLVGHAQCNSYMEDDGTLKAAFPVGTEREAINKVFDELIGKAKEEGYLHDAKHNTDTYNIVRYSIESEADYVEGNNILDGSEQRNVGKRPGEQTGRVGKSSRRGSEKTIQERQRFLRELKADQKEEKILTDSAGRKHKFTVVKKTSWNEHMKSLATRYEAQGVAVEFVDGGISIAFLSKKHLARGMRDGDVIYVSYNNHRFSPEQIAEHEFIHNKYATNEVQEAKKQILERMPEGEYNKAIEQIEEAYSGIVNKTALEEELICNILSGMYENTAEYADVANEYWSKAESDISGYDVSQYAESIDAGGELNESRNTQELGEQGISENNDSVWQRSDDSERVYVHMGDSSQTLRGREKNGYRYIDWGRIFGDIDDFKSREKEYAYGVLRKISKLDITGVDLNGRTLSNVQQEYFNNTVAKNSKGKLIPLYHATDSMFTEFLFGDFAFHVGTLEQAIDRGKNYIKEVYVNITNPIFIPGDLGYWTTSDVALLLVDEGILGNEQYETIRTLEGFRNSKYGTEANRALINELKKQRYDGIVYKNDFESKGLSFMAFDSNQIKYTSNKNPTTNSELNYSFVDDNEYDFDDFWNEAVQTYGAIPEGEKPAREVSVPKKISDTEPVSYFARTMMEAGVTPDEALSEFEQAILDGTMSHEVITDKRALRYAQDTIKRDGFDQAMEDWSRDSARGKVGKKDLAVGMELYNQCVNNKDYKNAMRIAAELAAEATRAGQTLQACRLLKQMSPDGQLYYLEKSVAKMNEEFKQQLGKKFEDIELDEELMEEFYTAESEEQRNEVYDRILQNIADQMPATLHDKWNSWRYLAMLGNPRTHIRNIIGNAVFVPAIRIKNYTGAALEQALKVDTSERTKSFTKSKEAVEFAKKDFNEMVEVLQGVNAKYAVTSDIDSKRQIFKTKALEKLRTKNFEFLEMEDMWFLKTHYVDALARIITARRLDVDNIDADALGKARAYAVKEAQAATYRDANVLAEGLNKLQRKAERSRYKTARVTSALIEGVMPFKKTPFNIAKQGIQYSPVSLLTGIYQLTKGVKEETHTVAEAIDTLSKGITGTGLMLLGYFLAQMGILVGDEEEPEKKRKFDKAAGVQSYAIKIGDFSYTIDWAAPACLPLFVGTTLQGVTKDGELSFKKVVDSLMTLPEPLLELSVFSGISDIIRSAQYEKTNPVTPIVMNMANNYITQALPTMGGQISRLLDPTKRDFYYEDKNSELPSGIQNFIGKVASKIPFISYLFEPSIDVWGREETYGGLFERSAENFVSPGYFSDERHTDVEKEVQALYERTGETDVLPREQPEYYTKNGTRYYTTAKQYAEAKKLRGQKSFELVEKLIKSSKYKGMNDSEKVKAIKKCYDKASDYTKELMFDKVKANAEK